MLLSSESENSSEAIMGWYELALNLPLNTDFRTVHKGSRCQVLNSFWFFGKLGVQGTPHHFQKIPTYFLKLETSLYCCNFITLFLYNTLQPNLVCSSFVKIQHITYVVGDFAFKSQFIITIVNFTLKDTDNKQDAVFPV